MQAHIDGDEFSAHILTDETEYNVEVRNPFVLTCYHVSVTHMFLSPSPKASGTRKVTVPAIQVFKYLLAACFNSLLVSVWCSE